MGNTADEFSDNHALTRMVYFVYRVYLYDYHGLIDLQATRHMFHDFFCHYEIFLLEFATALKWRREFLKVFDGRWDMLPIGIEKFFRTIGLAGVLPPDHEFIYFPSAKSLTGDKKTS